MGKYSRRNEAMDTEYVNFFYKIHLFIHSKILVLIGYWILGTLQGLHIQLGTTQSKSLSSQSLYSIITLY